MNSFKRNSLVSAKKIKFQEDVFAIVSVANQQIVVFNSGSCLLLHEAISKHEFLSKSYLQNEEKLLWVDASPCESSLLIFLLTLTDSGVHKLYSLSLIANGGEMEKSSERAISRDSTSLRSWCIKSEIIGASFLTLWSDGQVHSYTGDCKSSTHLLTIPGIGGKEKLAMEALDACHIVIVRSNPCSGCSYELWDTRYSTKKICKSINSAMSQNLQAKVVGGTLFLPSDQSIVAEQLKIEFSTLAAVVGKSSNNVEVQKDMLYSWTPDGILHEEPAEVDIRDKISNPIFSAVPRKALFRELLARLHHADAKKISSYLREIKLISELKLVRLLQYLLREHHPDFNEEACAKQMPAKIHVKHVKEFFLLLFCIPYNDIFLQQHLRKLSFKEAFATLKILCLLLNEDLSNATYNYDGSIYLCITQIANWISSLLSSHLDEFISVQKELPTMRDVYVILCDKVKEYIEVKDLQFQHKKCDFESCTSTNYCIESMYL